MAVSYKVTSFKLQKVQTVSQEPVKKERGEDKKKSVQKTESLGTANYSAISDWRSRGSTAPCCVHLRSYPPRYHAGNRRDFKEADFCSRFRNKEQTL